MNTQHPTAGRRGIHIVVRGTLGERFDSFGLDLQAVLLTDVPAHPSP